MPNEFFKLEKHGTTVRRELTAGVTPFLTMAYIVVVNPAILSDAGMDFGGVFVATCLSAAIGTAIMGLWANYPVAMAMPFTFSIADGLAIGFISYAVIKLLSGRHADAKPAVLALAALFIAKYAWLG